MLRSFKRADFVLFREFVANRLGSYNIDTDSNNLNELLESLIDEADNLFIPRVQFVPDHRPPLPRTIRHLMDERARSFARMKCTGLDAGAIEFKRIRNLTRAPNCRKEEKSGTGNIGRKPRSRVLLQDFKT
ncbi:unnamed protein product [Echinostoma caproni]|uniref:Uncharacterized protein n=1 Tax=Echinostoma caproni TaxID=27848 RepID=A0A183BEF7_9TREM|nr:unnamed protein product [Echinostoma caproni]